MSSEAATKIRFGPFEVTSQVFLKTPHSFALVNLKPLLPGHVLVCPTKPHKRLTDLSPPEVTDLFTTVQRVERMLARHYFPKPSTTTTTTSSSSSSSSSPPPAGEEEEEREPKTGAGGPTWPATGGSFNIAVQDGPEAGQTVSHVHVHIIPRIRGLSSKPDEGAGDELYERMADEAGNVGGALWDRALGRRPVAGGRFDRIEDSQRGARSMEEMEAEAEVFRRVLREMEEVEEGGGQAS
ncbi:Bis(5'-nucleosyl)-tetraphosphatase [asymmetrical] [Cytospora mali]|uniref:Bis(5'-adenosyl)-triphosphatase n=1 Tax=Cytospora mali TaxID=578113 RepID=A0A194VX02_CYTMA|nr:Bis(5'-nucleosyl)-tetraphosphatase [asymmetrical] [Valsa mali]